MYCYLMAEHSDNERITKMYECGEAVIQFVFGLVKLCFLLCSFYSVG